MRSQEEVIEVFSQQHPGLLDEASQHAVTVKESGEAWVDLRIPVREQVQDKTRPTSRRKAV